MLGSRLLHTCSAAYGLRHSVCRVRRVKIYTQLKKCPKKVSLHAISQLVVDVERERSYYSSTSPTMYLSHLLRYKSSIDLTEILEFKSRVSEKVKRISCIPCTVVKLKHQGAGWHVGKNSEPSQKMNYCLGFFHFFCSYVTQRPLCFSLTTVKRLQ